MGTTRRPDAPYIMPEGDIETFRQMYRENKWKNIDQCRALLEEAYQEFKRTNEKAKKAALPDTFKEVLEQEQGQREGDKTKGTFPTWLYMGVIGRANFILQDTRAAQETLAYIDRDKQEPPPVSLHKLHYEPKETEDSRTMAESVYMGVINAELFTRPDKFMRQWLAEAKSEKEKQEILAFQKTLTKTAFQKIVHSIAGENEDAEKMLSDPKRRSSAQYEELIKEIRRTIAHNTETVYHSLFVKVIHQLIEKGKSGSIRVDTWKTLQYYAAAYFFAQHPEKDFRGQEEISEADAAEALAIYNRMYDYVTHRKRGTRILAAVVDFIESENPQEETRQKILRRIETTQKDETIAKYSSILQNKATNTLAHVSKRLIKPDKYSPDAEFISGDVKLTFKNFHELNLTLATQKVLDTLVLSLTRILPYNKALVEGSVDKNREIELTLDAYMETCGLKDAKEARNQLNKAIKDIYNESVDYIEQRYTTGKNGKRKLESTLWHSHILDATGIDLSKPLVNNGKVKVKFVYDIAKMLLAGQIMPYPLALLKVNANANRHSFYLGRKLAEHHNMNYWKSNANIIGVKSLVEACPDLPSYDEVMRSAGKQVKQRIIDPFERDLMNLKEMGILASWSYCNPKEQPITDEQILKYDYATWITWLVKFELADYPARKRKEKTPPIKGIEELSGKSGG